MLASFAPRLGPQWGQPKTTNGHVRKCQVPGRKFLSVTETKRRRQRRDANHGKPMPSHRQAPVFSLTACEPSSSSTAASTPGHLGRRHLPPSDALLTVGPLCPKVNMLSCEPAVVSASWTLETDRASKLASSLKCAWRPLLRARCPRISDAGRGRAWPDDKLPRLPS